MDIKLITIGNSKGLRLTENLEIEEKPEGSEISKTRPVVVVSRNEMNTYLDTVVVCPLTTKLHPKWRSRIRTVCGDSPAEIAVDQIRTISKTRLTTKIGTLSPGDGLKLRLLITEMYGEQ